MHSKYLVFSRRGLLAAAALACCVPAASAQVVIHPDWIIAYAFPETAASTEPVTSFGTLAPVPEPGNALAVESPHASLMIYLWEFSTSGMDRFATEFPGSGAHFAPVCCNKALFPAD